jgi:hypothetical protein
MFLLTLMLLTLRSVMFLVTFMLLTLPTLRAKMARY